MKSIDTEFYEIYQQLEDCSHRMGKLWKRVCELKGDEIPATTSSVLTALQSNDGCTANELARSIGTDKESVRKILYSLQKQKKVVSSGRKICEVTNNEALCWWLKG